MAVNEILKAFFDKSFHFSCLFSGDRFTIRKQVKNVLVEAVPKLQFWNSNLEIRSFARLKA
ncbi:MAG: hypothetical protein LBR96_00300 [Treponema sp.]|jgi:hypothetical protein|nr:hypothetical protein [Treponema sp.]